MSDVEAAELMAFDDQVGREDTALVESVQCGVRSGLIERGRLLLDSEDLIASFQGMCAKRCIHAHLVTAVCRLSTGSQQMRNTLFAGFLLKVLDARPMTLLRYSLTS